MSADDHTQKQPTQSSSQPPPTTSTSSLVAPTTTTGSSSRGGVTRVIAKLETAISTGNYYEAHQMYRTLYFRYTSQKRYTDCLDLLYGGSHKLITKEQYTSAADLALLIVDTLEKQTIDNVTCELWINRLSILISQINANIVERETLLMKAVKWSGDASKNKMGHPLMHKLLAQIMWSEDNIDQARHHFLLSRDGPGCGQMLIQLSQTKGYPSETDLFIAQVVLQQLCLKEDATAQKTFDTYTQYHPKIQCSTPPFIMPLLNFVFYLLKSIEIGKLSMFTTLCELYKTSLARDPSYEKYLQKIGVIFFKAPTQPVRNNGGLFGDFINQLFQGMDDNDLPRTSNDQHRSTETDLD